MRVFWALAIAAALAGCGSSSAGSSSSGSSPSGSSPAGSGAAAVTISSYAYKPASISVTPGAKITFTNRDSTAHTATASAAPAAFDTGTIGPGQARTVTLARAGTFTYYCQFHAFMRATVVVK